MLDKPVTKVYDEFKQNNPDIKISESKFSKLRPGNVKTTHHKRLYQSMCEYCMNAKLKMEAMNTACERAGAQGCKINEVDKLVKLLCVQNKKGINTIARNV